MITKKSSKELLADSMMDLLQTESFEKITVSQITENCGIAKRTFYYHFRDKYELALWLYIHQLDVYYEKNRGNVTFRGFLTYSANIIWNDRYLIRKIIQYSGQNDFRHSVFQPLIDRYLYMIEHDYHEPVTDEIRDAVAFYVGGMITYVERGLSGQEIPTPECSVRIFESCIPEQLRHYLTDP